MKSENQNEINIEGAKETVLQVINYSSTEFLCKWKLVAELTLSQLPWYAGQNSYWNWYGLVDFSRKKLLY